MIATLISMVQIGFAIGLLVLCGVLLHVAGMLPRRRVLPRGVGAKPREVQLRLTVDDGR